MTTLCTTVEMLSVCDRDDVSFGTNVVIVSEITYGVFFFSLSKFMIVFS